MFTFTFNQSYLPSSSRKPNNWEMSFTMKELSQKGVAKKKQTAQAKKDKVLRFLNKKDSDDTSNQLAELEEENLQLSMKIYQLTCFDHLCSQLAKKIEQYIQCYSSLCVTFIFSYPWAGY